MFTGIVETIGTVKSVQRSRNTFFIQIEAHTVLNSIHIGDSIAVNGVCLTVIDYDDVTFQADIMNETLKHSSLGSLRAGSHVNIERAIVAGRRFSGHIVSGHIDGIGVITDIKNDGIAIWYTFSAEKPVMRYIVEKGSIAIDGISFTVAKVTFDNFSISMIPYTAKKTILFEKKTGDIVNLENDIIGKYVETLIRPKVKPEKDNIINMKLLTENGFI